MKYAALNQEKNELLKKDKTINYITSTLPTWLAILDKRLANTIVREPQEEFKGSENEA